MAAWLSWLTVQIVLLIVNLSGYSQHYVATDFGRLHYLTAPGTGDLPPVLLLHGIGSRSTDLYFLMQALRPQVRRIIAVDLPAHGLSEVDVAALTPEQFQASVWQGLDRILADEEPVLLFGNSLGGWEALHYAGHSPGELAALVVVSPAGAPPDEAEAARLRRIFEHDSLERPERLIAMLFDGDPLIQWFLRPFVYDRFQHPALRTLVARIDARLALDPDALGRLQMPVLLIWGQRDRIFPVGAEFFSQALPPGSTVLQPADFTHAPYVEDGMEHALVKLMLDWVRCGHCSPLQGVDPAADASRRGPGGASMSLVLPYWQAGPSQTALPAWSRDPR